MRNTRLGIAGTAVLAMVALVATLWQASGAVARTNNDPQPFADPAFQRVWTRTDQLVQQGQVNRSWFWGPTPRTATHEPNQESPGGTRLVQYFDKSRMEINDPNADPTNPFYVTNGLLTVELISGNMQIGANAFSPRSPACIPIAGDSDDPTAPTYNAFRTVSSVGGGIDHPESDKRGQVVTATIDRNGTIGNDPSKSSMTGATDVYYEPATRHNIPQVFWNFLNQQGLVIENGQTVTRQLITPWFYASGYPISDAFWAHVKVAGTYTDVLIQAYQRRVLTYNPGNTSAFQVEMGNIGLHYFDWRYNNAGVCAAGSPSPVASATAATSTTPVSTATAGASATATATSTPATPAASATPIPLTGKIAWVSNRDSKPNVWIMNADGTTPVNLTGGPTTGNNTDPAFSPDGSKIAFVSTRAGHTEVFTMTASGGNVTRLTTTTNATTISHPAWSTDGKTIAYASDQAQVGDLDIWVMNADGSNPRNITRLPGNDHDPTWTDDNRVLFVSNRSGHDQIYLMNADGTAVIQLTNSSGDNQLPAFSPSRNRILFVSTRDGGNPEIYLMRLDGSQQTRLTNLQSNEFDPAWSPDSSLYIYSSNRNGPNYDLFVANFDGTFLRQLTDSAGSNTRPTWH